MTSLYKQSVPVLIKYLHNLSAILKKSADWATENGMTHEHMLTFRLRDDMRPLTYQVQSCSNTTKFMAPRLASVPDTYFEDDETTFEQLQARIERTVSILESIPADAVDAGSPDAELIVRTTRMGAFRFTRQSYVAEFVIPNFHFHLSTAYCIVRHLGVPLDAMDYHKGVFERVEQDEEKKA